MDHSSCESDLTSAGNTRLTPDQSARLLQRVGAMAEQVRRGAQLAEVGGVANHVGRGGVPQPVRRWSHLLDQQIFRARPG